jgi:hypothetical protein
MDQGIIVIVLLVAVAILYPFVKAAGDRAQAPPDPELNR